MFLAPLGTSSKVIKNKMLHYKFANPVAGKSRCIVEGFVGFAKAKIPYPHYSNNAPMAYITNACPEKLGFAHRCERVAPALICVVIWRIIGEPLEGERYERMKIRSGVLLSEGRK